MDVFSTADFVILLFGIANAAWVALLYILSLRMTAGYKIPKKHNRYLTGTRHVTQGNKPYKGVSRKQGRWFIVL